MSKSFFITGIDTDAGKTYCTAWLARLLAKKGKNVITQKFIQTGNTGHSEDIDAHRALTGTGVLPEDRLGLTAPVIFSFPASAQLAARIDNREIDLSVIDNARHELEKRYDIVLVEGAGGMMVPITDEFFAIDYAASRELPVWLVTNSRLGSINHTVLSLEVLKTRKLRLEGILFNHHFDSDKFIAEDTCNFVKRYVARHFPHAHFLDVPSFGSETTANDEKIE